MRKASSIVLVGGGARSGKSRFALDYAASRYERLALLATARADDDEMRERIRRHRQARGPRWTTIEEPVEITAAIERQARHFDAVVVDCLTLWLSNVLLDPARGATAELAGLEVYLKSRQGPPIVLVTNEVGCGIVPENALAREYRDLAGAMNQKLARLADEVYWMVFGVPLTVKAAGR